MSNLPWFKLYADARVDKKLGTLTLAERGVWINLLCYASEQDDRGTFDASDREMLAIECAEDDVELLNSTLDKLLKMRHLIEYHSVTPDVTSVTSGNDSVTSHVTSNVLQFRTFHARQTQKVTNFPSDAPERVRDRVAKHRASRKQAQNTRSPVTSVTSGNGTDRDIDRDNTDILSVFDVSNVTPLKKPGRQSKQGEPLTRSRKEAEPRIWDALVEAFGKPNTKTERSNYGRVATELRDAGATYDEVKRRIANHHADWELTLNALTSWWTRLDRQQNPSRPRASQNGHAAAVGDIPRTIAFED